MKKIIVIASVALLLTGCAENWKVRVESDTSWYGTVYNHDVQGTGSKDLEIKDDPGACVELFKTTDGGRLTIQLYLETGLPLFPDENREAVTTTASGGRVRDCIP